MKALVFNNIKNLEYKEVQTPKISSGEVLLEVKACGICSSDIDRYNSSGAYHYPIILGHEISGNIIEAYDEENKELVGKRAIVFPLLPCKKCENCKNSNWAQCTNYDYFGSRRDGGFAQYLAVPVWNIKTFDENIPYEVAALCEPAAVAAHAISKISESDGKNILIIGSGTIGIFIGFWAQMKKITPVFLSRNKQKTEFLNSLGFNKIIKNTEDNKYDVCIESVGTEESLKATINAVKTMGKVILVGNPKKDMSLDKKTYWKILRQEIRIEGIWNSVYEKDWKFVLKNIEKIPASKLISHRFNLQEGAKAFEILSNKNLFKVKGTYIIE